MDSSEASELTKHATNVIDKARFFMFLLLFLLILSVNRTRSFTLCDMDENDFFSCCAVLANTLAEFQRPRSLTYVRGGCLPVGDEQLLVRDYDQLCYGYEIPEGCDW